MRWCPWTRISGDPTLQLAHSRAARGRDLPCRPPARRASRLLTRAPGPPRAQVMKVIFITASLSIVYIIRFGVPHKDSYNKEDDAFPSQYLIVPALLLGVVINQDHKSLFEIIWAFSIYLEAVAILPQLFMLQKQGGAESLTSHYVMLLGLYRLFYLFNWIYRYATEDNYMQIIVWVSGIVQTALYLDFFYNYISAKREHIDAPIELPA